MERVIEYTIPSGTEFRNTFGTILNGTQQFTMDGYTTKEILAQAKEFKDKGATNIQFLKTMECKHCQGLGYTYTEDKKLTQAL
jgi:hypothetical protein